MRRKLPRILGLLALAVSLLYLGRVVARHTSTFPAVSWSPAAVAAVAGAVGLHLLMVLAGALAWHLLLRSVDREIPLRAVLTVCCLAQPAKYLPGNVGQYLGRAVLARRHGISVGDSAVTIVYETAGLIVAGAAFATFAGVAGMAAAPWKLALLVLGAVLVIAVLRHRLPGPSAATLAGCLALYSASFAFGSLAFYLLAHGLFAAGEISWARVAPAFAVSWVAGFITPGAPGGLGVREALLVAGTAPFYGPEAALSTALAFRLVTVTGDGLAFLAGLAGSSKRRGASPPIQP